MASSNATKTLLLKFFCRLFTLNLVYKKNSNIFLTFLLLLTTTTTTFLSLATADPNPNPKAEVVAVAIKDQGVVVGNYDTTAWSQQRFMQFRGVPYAESPTGHLRFKAPVARQRWPNYVDATKWGRRCPVITTTNNLSEAEKSEDLEDCLNLCVYTKNLTAKTPVMMYIHGGGFYNGTSLDHPPHYLMEKDIVLVVPQRRIGALGFISTATDEIPGNAAIADMLFALQWIQDHISTFGGDSERVTIFGQSAGAAIVGALVLSPKTPNNYFQHAIMQSGSIMANWATLEEPELQAQRICVNLGCQKCENVQAMNECLMKVSVLELLNATSKEYISPVIADKLGILPETPAKLFKNFNKNIKLMAGFTKHDGSYLVGEHYNQMLAAYGEAANKMNVRKYISAAMHPLKDATRLTNNLSWRLFFTRDILDGNNHTKALPSYFDLYSVLYFKSPVLAFTSASLEHNQAVFLYTFDYEGQHTRFGYEMGNEHFPFNGGVHHSNDNLYLFSTHTLNDKDAKVAQKMVNLWTSFAIDGVPSADDDNVAIHSMESESGPYFHINEDTKIGYDAFDEFTVTIDDPFNYKLIRQNKMSFL